jgi:endonuclease/exonuclease/phosphatase family metal-dependent hydrolase
MSVVRLCGPIWNVYDARDRRRRVSREMRPSNWVVAVALAFTVAAPPAPRLAAYPGGRPPLRVLTYNIHHGQGIDGEFDLPRLARVIASVAPDLVGLQEVDQGTVRSGGVNQLTELGRLVGMDAVFGKTIEFQRGDYGVGVLSRLPIVRANTHPLPNSPSREPRVALTVEVDMGEGALLQFTTTHLDQGRDPTNRIRQADYLNELLAGDAGGPGILAGDMNSGPDTEVMQILGARWTDVVMDQRTTELGRVQRRLDYVMARPVDRWRTIDSKVVDAQLASDHLPVLAVLEWMETP